MFRIFHSILEPPSKPDEDQDRVARWLHYILMGGITGAFLITVTAYFFHAVESYVISIPFMLVALLAFGINKLGRTNTATFILLILLVGTVTYAIMMGGGIHDTIVILYPVILVIGGLILRPRIYWVLVAITLTSTGCVIYAETQKWLVTRFSAYTDATDFVLMSSILVVQAFIVNLLINNLIGSLKKARQENLERLRVEQERESIIRELELRNDELLRFNYTVSHELKSPIVTIKGFLGSVQMDMARDEYEKASKDLLRVVNATDKMNQTLNDLLELSRVGQMVASQQRIEMPGLVEEVVDALGGQLHQRNIQVRIMPGMPDLYGNRTRLREVFENLITNAIKYMGDQPDPAIEIGCKQRDGETVFYTKDNGMGIAPQYHARVFNLFEKLDPTSEGTGVGLALVKRIIETHGGRIWVESEGMGKGTVFYFTLPGEPVI